jgi:hypothetical protein
MDLEFRVCGRADHGSTRIEEGGNDRVGERRASRTFFSKFFSFAGKNRLVAGDGLIEGSIAPLAIELER